MDFHQPGLLTAHSVITPCATACTATHHSLTTGAAGLHVMHGM